MAEPKTESKTEPKTESKTVDPKLEALKKERDGAYSARDTALARLKAEQAKTERLEQENGQLRSLVQKLREDAPPELGDGAYLLTKSVTFGGADGKMIDGKVGDVVVVSTDDRPADCRAVTKKLGAGYRAYPVSPKTLDELHTKDMLRA